MNNPNGPIEAILNEEQFPGNWAAYQDLLTFINQGKILTLSGAGVSVPAFPTWDGLLSSLLTEAKNSGVISSIDELDALRQDPLELAAALEDSFSRNVFRAKLSKIFHSTAGLPTEAHKQISELHLKGIVTLNFDKGHEIACSQKGRHAEVGRSQDPATIARWMQGDVFDEDNIPIMHLHGDASSPENMVFTSDDYDRFYSDSLIVSFLSQIWRNERLLVIGFGFSDPFLTRLSEHVLRSLVVDNRHYALIGKRSDKGVSAHERRFFAKKYRLTPIYYSIRECDGSSGGGREDHSDLIELLKHIKVASDQSSPDKPTEPETVSPVDSVCESTVVEVSVGGVGVEPANALRREFERDLFVSPLGGRLYVEPRLVVRSSSADEFDAGTETAFSVGDVLSDSSSYFIVAQSERGATTLGKRIAVDLAARGVKGVYKDASFMPNYKRKLREIFESDGVSVGGNVALVLDNFDLGRDERLLKELIGLGLFERFFILVKVSFFEVSSSVPIEQFSLPFKVLTLAHLHRGDIRTLTGQFYDTDDQDVISFTVDKIYRDLVDLCIPITPANVIMYLSVLYKEGDFNPINRVQIVERYLVELLRKPSDAFRESFSSRNKVDIVAAFAFAMFKSDKTSFTEYDWYQYCRSHMESSLTLFDERQLLIDLTASRIFVKFGQHIAFKYRFFHSYFLGAYIAHHPKVLSEFIASSEYLAHTGLVEVIAELKSDNNELMSDIVDRLNSALSEFGSKFVPENFDPFAKLEWSNDPKEEEGLWKPLAKVLEDGPRNVKEIDEIKRSIIGESLSANQQIVVQKFDQVERRLVLLYRSLVDALANADSLDGKLKLEATRTILKTFLRLYQVGLVLSPALVERPYFFWFGLLFINEMKLERLEERQRVSAAMFGMHRAVISKAADQIGSRKLGEVYKVLARDPEVSGFLGQIVFAALLRSKPKDWLKAASDLIARTGQREYYLKAMLISAFDQYYDEVNTGADRENLKKLIATIRIKRDMKKNHPGEGTVAKVVNRLQFGNYFEKKN